MCSGENIYWFCIPIDKPSDLKLNFEYIYKRCKLDCTVSPSLFNRLLEGSETESHTILLPYNAMSVQKICKLAKT